MITPSSFSLIAPLNLDKKLISHLETLALSFAPFPVGTTLIAVLCCSYPLPELTIVTEVITPLVTSATNSAYLPTPSTSNLGGVA